MNRAAAMRQRKIPDAIVTTTIHQTNTQPPTIEHKYSASGDEVLGEGRDLVPDDDNKLLKKVNHRRSVGLRRTSAANLLRSPLSPSSSRKSLVSTSAIINKIPVSPPSLETSPKSIRTLAIVSDEENEAEEPRVISVEQSEDMKRAGRLLYLQNEMNTIKNELTILRRNPILNEASNFAYTYALPEEGSEDDCDVVFWDKIR